MVAFAIAGAMLTWGHNFSSDYVGKELSSQNISFPSKTHSSRVIAPTSSSSPTRS